MKFGDLWNKLVTMSINSMLKATVSCHAIISTLLKINALEVSNEVEKCMKIENGICMPNDYDKRQLPSMPITIKVSITILTLTEIDDKLATVEFLSYVILEWQDPRLLKIFGQNIIDRTTLLDNNIITLSAEWANDIWQPDLFITGLKDLKQAKYKSNTGKDEGLNFILSPKSCKAFVC